MGGRTARRLCPSLVVVPARFKAYTEASKAMFEIFDETSPVVEGLSIDEAFIDVRGMRRIAGSPEEIARRLRDRVRDEVGLPVTVGVARTKFLAKVPRGGEADRLLVVPPEELAFLHPLPVERLWGVGQDRGEAARARADDGRPGRGAGRVDAGGDARAARRAPAPRSPTIATRGACQVGVRRRSIGGQRAIGRGPHTDAELDSTLVALIDRVTRRMRRAKRVARTVVLRLRFSDYRARRARTISEATAQTRPLLGVARELLAEARPLIAGARDHAARHLAHEPLNADEVQLALPLDANADRAGHRARQRPRPLRLEIVRAVPCAIPIAMPHCASAGLLTAWRAPSRGCLVRQQQAGKEGVRIGNDHPRPVRKPGSSSAARSAT
jgi:DNA polymerase-4